MAAMRHDSLPEASRPVLRALDGGRKADRRTAAEEHRLDLLAHNAEAVEFVGSVRPLVDRLHLVAVEIGPVAMQTVMALRARLDRYERRHVDPDGAA